MPRALRSLWALVLFAVLACRPAPPGGRVVRVAVVAGLQESGLLAELSNAFEARSGYHLDATAVSSEKALEVLRTGGADAAISRSPADEQAAVIAGEASRRAAFMHEDFVLLGPEEARSALSGVKDVRGAMKIIAGSGKRFVSRGDGSDVNQRELSLWKMAGLSAEAAFIEREPGDMAAVLGRASKEGAFTLADRKTYLARKGEIALVVVFQGDPLLRATYAVLEASTAKGAKVNAEGARRLTEFLRSPEGRGVIGAFAVKTYGEAIYVPEGG